MIEKSIQDELRKKYNPEGSTLRNAQFRMLDILKFVGQLCDKHGLKYWITAGTLLGAYRHGGFIPWDDDLDIEMPIEDFKKLKVIMSNLSSDYILQDHTTDPFYFYSYAKIRDKYSLCEAQVKSDDNLFNFKGIWIDIFPVEEYNVNIQKLSFFTYSYGRRFFTCSKFLHFIAQTRYILNYYLLFPFFRFLTHILPRNKGYLNNTLGCEYLYPHKKENIYPLTQIKFEGFYFNAPYKIENILTDFYGKDYMQLPPEKMREGHYLAISFYNK